MAVGIGKQIKQAELITIAGNENRVVNAKNFEDLNNQLDDIREATCSKYHLPSIKERLVDFNYSFSVCFYCYILYIDEKTNYDVEDVVFGDITPPRHYSVLS